MVTTFILALVALAVIWTVCAGIRVVNQIERGIVFRFGKAQRQIRGPGITLMIPYVDRMKKVNVQIVTMPIPTQEGITRDNVSVQVDAVAYFRVQDPLRAAIEVQNYLFAVEQVAQTSLRSIIGKSLLDDLLTNREELNKGLALMIDSPALSWGIHIDRVEIKDVQLPDSMKRSMSRQAEAERERRARVITADGEYQAAQKLADASAIMSETPGALQLRLLQTVVEVAAEKTSTLVMPLPVELLRFFERATGPAEARSGTASAERAERPAETPAELPAEQPAEQPAVPRQPSPEGLADRPAVPEISAPEESGLDSRLS
ncbi:SPFH domain-containing protein [Nonomuraea sp. NPDC050536]|uniref:slipin family protein n=1 Tax=Nonomuraea sp. NPDC050536 TaxID=3364366 RepID=UPI0037CB9FCD